MLFSCYVTDKHEFCAPLIVHVVFGILSRRCGASKRIHRRPIRGNWVNVIPKAQKS